MEARTAMELPKTSSGKWLKNTAWSCCRRLFRNLLIRSKRSCAAGLTLLFTVSLPTYYIMPFMRILLFISFLFQFLITVAQTTDAKGRKQGYWKKKEAGTDKLLYEGEFKDDLPVGKFKYY